MTFEEKIGLAIDKIAEGKEAEGQKAIEKIIVEIKRELSQNENKPALYEAWGICCEVLEEFEQALLKYEKLLESDPDNQDILWRMANIAYDSMDKPETAQVIIKSRLLELAPENAVYLKKLKELDALILSRKIRLDRSEKGESSNKPDEIIGNKTPPPTVH